MKRFLPATLLMLGCALLFSCQQMHQKQDASAKKEATIEIPPPLHLGAVHQVFSNDKFALLRIIGPMPKSGTVLITHPMDGTNSRIGNLIVSSEFAARNGIIAADIRSGTVVKGDRVFQYRNISRRNEQERENESTEAVAHPILDTVPDSVVKEMEATPEPLPEEPSDAPTATEPHEPEFTPQPELQPTTPDSGSNTPPAYLDEIPDDISGWN
jgi:hypothetical protein